MEKQFAEIYNKMAQKLNSIIPVEWNELYYLGEVEKDKMSWSSVFYFTQSNNVGFVKSHDIPTIYGVSQQVYRELLSELDAILLELYSCFELNEQELWEQINFYLNSKGKFNVDFKYNVMHENDGGQLKREIVWAYEKFDFVPKEGSYSKKVLDKYIMEKSE